jgi:cell division protein YceG involved in septum cleavage
MQNNKKHSKVLLYIVTFVLATVLFIGVEISAIEKEKPKIELTEKDKITVKKETQKKKVVKAPPIFVPTDKVSADKAVAFPTDI